MKKSLAAFSLLFLLLGIFSRASAQTSALGLPMMDSDSATKASGTSTENLESAHKTQNENYLIKASLMTSHAGQQNNYRNTKNSGSDDSGQMSDNTTLPNMSYFSGMGVFRFTPSQIIGISGLQSLDSEKDRTMANPNGPAFILPGQLLVARYQYSFANDWYLNANQIYTDVFQFFDPSLGVAHASQPDVGWGHRASLNFTAPISERSMTDHQFTRAFSRLVVNYKRPRWNAYAGLGGSKVFYQNTPPSKPAKNSLHAETPADNGGEIPSTPSFSPGMIDVVLGDRQDARASTSAGGSYEMTQKLRYATSTAISYIHTMGNHQLWLTTFKPISLTYQVAADWEVGSDLTLYSNIEEYQHPTAPQLWNLGVRLSYRAGNLDLVPR